MSQSQTFAGKAVLISGATSGIGRAAALAFAGAGARLLLTGRDPARGAAVESACRALGAEALFHPADLRDPAAPGAAVRRALERFGRLDVAFNNAGFQERRAALPAQSLATYEAVFDLNARALFLAMQAQIPAMLAAGGGAIVNNVSVSALRNPNPGLALYAAAKAAALAMTRAAAMEHAAAGLRINAVSPGRVETPMLLAAGLDPAKVAASLPLGRMGRPEEVAAAVLWLASPAASYVVGHNLCADGGFLAA
jgi:NAD(P)-dependent dehydrogenase (short-subunit alcohol dehydrogenase family)